MLTKGVKVMQKKRTQTSDVLDYLKRYKRGLTPREAEDKFGSMRLASIICNLRNKGYNIETLSECTKNRYGTISTYARYKLK